MQSCAFTGRMFKTLINMFVSLGFLRGLRFHGKYAFIGVSKPRYEVFQDLPVAQELAARNQKVTVGNSRVSDCW